MKKFEVMKHNLFSFPAGTYYIGDPCYVVPDEHWFDLLLEVDYFQLANLFTWDGQLCGAHSTAYGDGQYELTGRMNEFYGYVPVDAGLVGVIPVELARPKFGNGYQGQEAPGVIYTFDEPFTLTYDADDEGSIIFGPVRVKTDEDYDLATEYY